jgi:hypothetical protein
MSLRSFSVSEKLCIMGSLGSKAAARKYRVLSLICHYCISLNHKVGTETGQEAMHTHHCESRPVCRQLS